MACYRGHSFGLGIDVRVAMVEMIEVPSLEVDKLVALGCYVMIPWRGTYEICLSL